MGTSTSYGGPRLGLVPTWLAGPTPNPVPPSAPPTAPGPGGPPVPPPQQKPQPTPQSPNIGGSLSGARNAFSRFAGSGSRSALERGLSHYVRSGTGGAGRATQRMGSSRGTAAKLIGVVRDFQRVGPAGALNLYALQGLAGRPAEEVFTRLLDAICPMGGTIDEAIARAGILEAIDQLAQAGVGNFDQLTSAQLEDFVANFISNTIEGRILNDIGSRGISLPDDVAAVDNIQSQLHDVISGCVRDAMVGKLTGVAKMSDQAVAAVADRIYEAAFDFVAALVDAR